MKTTCILVFVALVLVQAWAAPQPFDWNQLGRGIVDLGRKAAPVVKNGCGLINGRQQQPVIYYVNYPAGQVPAWWLSVAHVQKSSMSTC